MGKTYRLGKDAKIIVCLRLHADDRMLTAAQKEELHLKEKKSEKGCNTPYAVNFLNLA